MRCYGWTAEHCWTGVTSAEGWVRRNWAVENEMTMFGNAYERIGDGYVRQEAKRILESWRTKAILK